MHSLDFLGANFLVAGLHSGALKVLQMTSQTTIAPAPYTATQTSLPSDDGPDSFGRDESVLQEAAGYNCVLVEVLPLRSGASEHSDFLSAHSGRATVRSGPIECGSLAFAACWVDGHIATCEVVSPSMATTLATGPNTTESSSVILGGAPVPAVGWRVTNCWRTWDTLDYLDRLSLDTSSGVGGGSATSSQNYFAATSWSGRTYLWEVGDTHTNVNTETNEFPTRMFKFDISLRWDDESAAVEEEEGEGEKGRAYPSTVKGFLCGEWGIFSRF